MNTSFFPVFVLGAVTFLAAMFASVNIYYRSERIGGWGRHALKGLALVCATLGSFSFAFGFPWAAFF